MAAKLISFLLSFCFVRAPQVFVTWSFFIWNFSNPRRMPKLKNFPRGAKAVVIAAFLVWVSKSWPSGNL